MKSVKKLSSLAITAVLSAATFAMPVLAAENTTTSTEFSYVKKNEPTYTVSIPSALALSEDGADLNIEATDVADLDGKTVSVTIAGTSYYRNPACIYPQKLQKPSYTGTLRYQLISSDDTIIETTGDDTATGKELASFTGNGTVTYKVKPVLGTTNQNLEPGVSYTGTMTFGIGLN